MYQSGSFHALSENYKNLLRFISILISGIGIIASFVGYHINHRDNDNYGDEFFLYGLAFGAVICMAFAGIPAFLDTYKPLPKIISVIASISGIVSALLSVMLNKDINLRGIGVFFGFASLFFGTGSFIALETSKRKTYARMFVVFAFLMWLLFLIAIKVKF